MIATDHNKPKAKLWFPIVVDEIRCLMICKHFLFH